MWGSRRLSVKDIHESYRLKYRHRTVLGALSYVGSHVLSLTYLALYGRYVSDTLSRRAWFVPTDVLRLPALLTDKLANQHLLSVLLRRKAEMFEVPGAVLRAVAGTGQADQPARRLARARPQSSPAALRGPGAPATRASRRPVAGRRRQAQVR